MDDFALLKAWAEGDRDAGALLFERHVDSLTRFFANKVSDASDLVQCTFLACLECPTRFQGRSSFRTYLLSIARFQLYQHYHSRALRDRRKGTTSAVLDAGPSPSTLLSRADRDRTLLAALRSLPPALQIILELAYWEELSGQELAEVLEIPLNTAYTRLHRAKLKLREALRTVEAEPAL